MLTFESCHGERRGAKKHDKKGLVSVAYTISNPRTVVVELGDTFAAEAAVL
jgi:hypothetical protein